MRGNLRIPPKSRISRMPKAWVESGYTGRVPFICNASTIVLIHPKATLEDTKKSLLMIIQDLEVRKKLGLNLQPNKNRKDTQQTEE